MFIIVYIVIELKNGRGILFYVFEGIIWMCFFEIIFRFMVDCMEWFVVYMLL